MVFVHFLPLACHAYEVECEEGNVCLDVGFNTADGLFYRIQERTVRMEHLYMDITSWVSWCTIINKLMRFIIIPLSGCIVEEFCKKFTCYSTHLNNVMYHTFNW